MVADSNSERLDCLVQSRAVRMVALGQVEFVIAPVVNTCVHVPVDILVLVVQMFHLDRNANVLEAAPSVSRNVCLLPPIAAEIQRR